MTTMKLIVSILINIKQLKNIIIVNKIQQVPIYNKLVNIFCTTYD